MDTNVSNPSVAVPVPSFYYPSIAVPAHPLSFNKKTNRGSSFSLRGSNVANPSAISCPPFTYGSPQGPIGKGRVTQVPSRRSFLDVSTILNGLAFFIKRLKLTGHASAPFFADRAFHSFNSWIQGDHPGSDKETVLQAIKELKKALGPNIPHYLRDGLVSWKNACQDYAPISSPPQQKRKPFFKLPSFVTGSRKVSPSSATTPPQKLPTTRPKIGPEELNRETHDFFEKLLHYFEGLDHEVDDDLGSIANNNIRNNDYTSLATLKPEEEHEFLSSNDLFAHNSEERESNMSNSPYLLRPPEDSLVKRLDGLTSTQRKVYEV